VAINVLARLRTARPLGAIGLASLFAFASHAAVTGEWSEGAARGQSFSRVLIVGVSHDINQRCAFERALAGTIKSESTAAIISCDSMDLKAPLTREGIEAVVAEKNADAVLATTLVAQEWGVNERGTRDTRGAGLYKPVDSYYGAYGIPVVYAEFMAAAPLTSIQGDVRITSKLYETRGATVVYTLDSDVKKIESRAEGLADITPPIAKKLRREKLIR
jgi:hypothetical protein